MVERRGGIGKDLVFRPGNHSCAALCAESSGAVRAGGAVVVSGTQLLGNPQRAQIVLDLAAKSFAARDGGSAGEHQDEIAAQRAIPLFDEIHVDEAGAADAQHWLSAQRQFRLLQSAPGVEAVL